MVHRDSHLYMLEWPGSPNLGQVICRPFSREKKSPLLSEHPLSRLFRPRRPSRMTGRVERSLEETERQGWV